MSKETNALSTQLTILHVDDDVSDQAAVRKLFATFSGVKFLACDLPGRIAQVASARLNISIVDLDYGGQLRDQEVIGMIRNIAPNSQIIVLSNFGVGDAKENKYGAQDVISKHSFQADPGVLLRAVTALIREQTNNTNEPPSDGGGDFELVKQEFHRALEHWRNSNQVDFRRLARAALRWIFSSPRPFVFFASLVISIIGFFSALLWLPISALFVCVTLSCLAIAHQCVWHIIESTRSNCVSSNVKPPLVRESKGSWTI